ncbi:MAG: hypothetical protein K2P92_04400, partial [Bdellovibrionaceae bacterium]|nr:hypothetical protein [Pseudobdellovibrionaceae bacterium]
DFLLFTTLLEMRTELKKPEHQEKALALILIPLEEILTNPKADIATTITALKEEMKCDILISAFDDPLKPLRPKNWPVPNIIYKPFDLTILKEQTHFALNPAAKTEAKYVHNAKSEGAIEVIQKFDLKELSEFGFKIDKTYQLAVGSVHKFYHPLFENKKQDYTLMHTWARVISETADHYELCFCQNTSDVLSHLRKRIAGVPTKVKHPHWQPPQSNIFKHATKKNLTIALELADPNLILSLKDLITRNFKNITVVEIAPVVHDPKKPVLVTRVMTADLLITEMEHQQKTLEAQFGAVTPLVIRLTDEVLEREKIEKRWLVETLRCDMHVDKAHLIKALLMLFPNLEPGGEEIHRISIELHENISLSEIVKTQEISEAAICLLSPNHYENNQMMDLALP